MSGVHRSSDASTIQETSPLLPRAEARDTTSDKSVLHRIFLCGFLVTLTFSITQVPILFAFRVMTCDAYYKNHPSPDPEVPDRCSVRDIEAGVAAAFALLAGSNTFFGLINLLVTGWAIKRFGVKLALVSQVFWPTVRLAIQTVGVMTGGTAGILIVQCSQIITIIGGPAGYILTLNSFVTDVVEHKERTGAIGRLQGCNLVGGAIGFLIGGLLGDAFGLMAPFRITLFLFLLCCLYIMLALPTIPPEKDVAAREASIGIARFVGPLRIFAPQKWILPDGRSVKHFGALTLGTGVFLAILATGYIPTLLQMYAANEFQFGFKDNGWLIFLYSSLRGLYLTFIFPVIISKGRKWMRPKDADTAPKILQEEESLLPHAPTLANEIAPIDPLDNDAEPADSPPLESEETFAFDLLYARYSLITDGILTGLAMFVSQGWQMYLIAAILPLAAGTGSASKGAILQMLPTSERVDALAGITLVENIARLSTTAVFGVIFALLAEAGKSWLVFGCNAAVATLGFIVLCLSRFPPEGSRRADA